MINSSIFVGIVSGGNHIGTGCLVMVAGVISLLVRVVIQLHSCLLGISEMHHC